MIQNIKNFIQERKEQIKHILFWIIVIFIIIIILAPMVQSSYTNYKNKQIKQAEDKYFIYLKDWVQEFNEKIPSIEDKIRTLKLQSRCYNSQIERIKKNEKFEVDFCKKKENLEKFSEKNKEEPQPVAFSFVDKVEADHDIFMPELPKPKEQPKKADFSILWTNEHKARYAYDYALKQWFSHNQALYLVAQLHQENWTLDEKRKWDNWCSVWLIQWNECAKKQKIPCKTRKWQIKIFVNELKTRFDKYWNFRQVQTSWNNPSVLSTWSYKTRYFYKTEEIFNNLF